MASKILLADDSITIQKVVNLTFADEGIDVVAVSNGEMAERRLGEINPDLVLADIFMPGKNGYELCEFIKQSPQFRDIPVILLVGAFEPFDQVEARRVHADAHLTKPFESRTLVETVRKLITSSGRPITTPLASPALSEEEVEESKPLAGTGGAPDTRPLPPPSFNIDLNAMKDDWSQSETPQRMTTAPLPETDSSDPAFPLDASPLDDSFFADSPGDPGLEIHVGSPAQADDHSYTSPPAFSSGRTEGEGLTFGEVPDSIDDDADPFKNLFGSEEGVSTEAPASQQGGGQTEEDDQFMVVDFGRVETPDQRDRNAVSFDMSVGQASDQGPGDTFEFTSDAHDADLNHAPAASIDPNHVSPSFDPGTGEFDMPDSGLSFVDQPTDEASSGTIFAVDDPLGDVLMDAGVEEPAQPESQAAPETVEFPVEQFEQSADPLNIEVAPPAPEPSAYSWAQDLDLPAASSGGVGEEAFAAGEVIDPGPLPEAAPEWEETVRGFEFSDSSFHPIDEDETEPVRRAEDSFTTSSMWSGQEALTAPIDIEATAVEEPAAASEERAEPEEEARGSAVSFSPGGRAPQAERPQPGGLELSPAVIDEIVRRVVAEMSESVVREIAWEVVPDCVERVIENLTKESLSKNH